MEDGTLIPEMTQTTSDGQRVIEMYEHDLDVDGETVTTHSAVQRPTTLAEQATHFADDIAAQAQGMVAPARSSSVEVGGSDEEPTITVTLYATKAPPEAAPQAAPAKAKAPAAKES